MEIEVSAAEAAKHLIGKPFKHTVIRWILIGKLKGQRIEMKSGKIRYKVPLSTIEDYNLKHADDYRK